MERSKTNLRAALAVISVYFLSLGVTAVQPALADIMDAFPDAPVSLVYLIVTLPTLIAMPINMAFGHIVGKTGFRKLAIAGSIVFTVSGCAPLILHNLSAILASRAVFGISIGFLVPMTASLVIALYEGSDRARMLGIGNMAANAGSIFYVMAGAFLCTTGWRNTFFVYLVGCVALLVIFFCLPEAASNDEEHAVDHGTSPLPSEAWAICMVYGAGMLFLYPFFLNFSSLVMQSGIGDAGMAGTLLSIGTIAGIICGALFPKISMAAGKHAVTIALACGAASCALLFVGRHIPFLCMGSILGGSCMTLLIASSTMGIGMVCDPMVAPRATGMAMAAMNLGSFLATFYAGALSSVPGQDPLRFVFIVSAIGFVLLVIVQELLMNRHSNV